MSSLRAQRALYKAAATGDGFFDDPWYWIKRKVFQYDPTIAEEIEHNYGRIPDDLVRFVREAHGLNPDDESITNTVVYNPKTKGLEMPYQYTPMKKLRTRPIMDFSPNSFKTVEELIAQKEKLKKEFQGAYNANDHWLADRAYADLVRADKEITRRQEEAKAAKKERDRQHIQQLRKETIKAIQDAQEANSPAGIARMTAQELGNNLLDIGNKALETGKNIGKKTLEVGGKAAKEGGKAAINWINAQADATRSAAETRREIARAKNKAIEEQTAAIRAAQAAQAAKEAQVSQYLGYAPWLLGGGLAGAGLGSAIGSQYKNTLLGAILGGAGGVGLGGLGKYVYDKYVSKQASADVDYSGVERRAKFRAMLG